MSVLELFFWLEYSSLLVEMRSSPWLFPLIASVHLLGLAVLGGSVLIVDLRLLGVGLARHAEYRAAVIPMLCHEVLLLDGLLGKSDVFAHRADLYLLGTPANSDVR